MSTLVLFMGLLALSYLGSSRLSRRGTRVLGLSSGLEAVALGVLVGPGGLGVVDEGMLAAFAPVAYVALGWLAFVHGVEALFVGGRRVRAGSVALGWLLSSLAAAAVGGATFLVATRLWSWPAPRALWLAAGLAAVGCDTGPRAIQRVVERHEADGPLARRLNEVAQAGSFVPLTIGGLLFAYGPPSGGGLDLPTWWWMSITVGVGLVLGAVAALLLARELRLDESWGVILGTSLYAMGLAVRLQFSPMCTAFFLGLALAALSRHQQEIVAMVAPTARAVTLPALLLAGTRIHLTSAQPLLVAAAAVAARLGAQLVFGGLLRAVAPEGRRAGGWLGLALPPGGVLSLAIALASSLRFPDTFGSTVLVGAAAVALAGELVGPASLRTALDRSGELGAPARPDTERTQS
jgi:Kef-type K+ transport system membrane component KefB